LNLMRMGKPLSHGLPEGEYEFLDPRTKPLFQYESLSLCIWCACPKPGLYLLDEAASLLRLFADEDGKRCCEVVHRFTLALTLAHTGLCHAVYDQDGGYVRVYVNSHEASLKWSAAAVPVRTFFGYAPVANALSFGLLALEHEDYWDICHAGGRTEVEVPPTLS